MKMFVAGDVQMHKIVDRIRAAYFHSFAMVGMQCFPIEQMLSTEGALPLLVFCHFPQFRAILPPDLAELGQAFHPVVV